MLILAGADVGKAVNHGRATIALAKSHNLIARAREHREAAGAIRSVKDFCSSFLFHSYGMSKSKPSSRGGGATTLRPVRRPRLPHPPRDRLRASDRPALGEPLGAIHVRGATLALRPDG